MVAGGSRPPNILVTGTPGTGKTTTCELIAEATSLRHINVGDWVQKGSLHSGWDSEHDSYLIDEDKVALHSIPESSLDTCSSTKK